MIFAGLDDGAPVPVEYIDGLHAVGIPYFSSLDRAFRALRHLNKLANRDFARADAAPVALDLPSGVTPEYRAEQILTPVGIPFPPGGVLLDIADDAALTAAWDKLHGNVAAYDASIALDGAQVEAMGKRGTELIIGARNDPDWGPVILAGFGGVTAELLHDVRLLPVDLTHDAIVAELRSLKQGALLDGYRGSPALDVDAVANLIACLGRVLSGTPSIREIDLNPVVVYLRGAGVVALDALILAE
ncbi:acetate--CoA ligase family protein [Sphingomonas sp. ZT3P38]|uniref:acetate--CoA ligase family protein n=1 Tax=Parasphingomonas zepuensis TaxID=3096161 RepID=UPI002FC9AA61